MTPHSNRSNILWWLLLFATATIHARSIPTINQERAHEAAREQVVWQGRLCPLSTPALYFLRTVYGEDTYHGLTPEQVVYGWNLRPDVWKDEPMILVNDTSLCRQLGIQGKYASFAQLFDDSLQYRLNNIGADLPPRLQQLFKESPAVVELDEKVGLIILLTKGEFVQPRPDSMAPKSNLRIEAEILYNHLPLAEIILVAIILATILISFFIWRKRRNGSHG